MSNWRGRGGEAHWFHGPGWRSREIDDDDDPGAWRYGDTLADIKADLAASTASVIEVDQARRKDDWQPAGGFVRTDDGSYVRRLHLAHDPRG